MSNALPAELGTRVFSTNIDVMISEVRSLVLRQQYSHREAFREFKKLIFLYESQDWNGRNLLPLQLKIIFVLELLKQKKPTA